MLDLFPFALQILILVIMPLGFLAWMILFKPPSLLAFSAKSLLVGSFIAFFFIAGRWDIVGLWLRYVWIVAFFLIFVAALYRYRSTHPLPDWTLRSVTSLAITIITALIFITSLWQLRGNGDYDGPPINLTFPLKDTRWYVAHGGSAPAMNHHASVHAQAYALDIGALNSVGLRAWGLLPETLNAYAIFGQEVAAPCAGNILSIENNLPDLTPPERDRSNLAGNHVLMRCDETLILLAHLRQNSITVQKDDIVQTGQRLGEVGNSGNTTEPHLHIHAVGDIPPGQTNLSEDILFTGKPVPMLFDGQFLTRNSWGF
ncbi:MAG: M23 family metallopeptidase [Geminicoccaceae bacterium]